MPMSPDRSRFDWGEIFPRVDAHWDQPTLVNPSIKTSTAVSNSSFFFKVLLTLLEVANILRLDSRNRGRD